MWMASLISINSDGYTLIQCTNNGVAEIDGVDMTEWINGSELSSRLA